MMRGPGTIPDRRDVAGERRLLTLVFVDLVDSTRLSAAIDPEDLAALIIAYQEAGERIFSAYGGYVAQFLGDGLLVYFGYPQASENDPERAVRAALELLGELDAIRARKGGLDHVRFEARVGIHTGAAVVGPSPHAGRSMIFGEAINVASRIQSAATPGTVLVSGATLPLLKGRFVTEDQGSATLKGVTQPMRLHRIVRLATRGPQPDAGATGPRVIGRTAQLERLAARWQMAGSGKPGAVAILGEPGMGKSSLLRAFRASVDPAAVTWLEAQCDPFSTGASLKPFISLIRATLGIPEDLPDAEAVRRLTRSLAALPAPMPEALPIVAQLLGLGGEATAGLAPESPEVLRQRTLDTLIEWVRRVALARPVILVCEDLHWSDTTTLEFIDRLVTRLAEAPVFCVMTFRPGHEKLPLVRRAERIELGPLSPAEGEALAREAAGAGRLGAAVLDNILQRAGGTPLFIAELARFSATEGEAGAQATRVPPTLDSLVLERLDRLAPQVKQVAQLASALGREFDFAFLQGVSNRDPGELEGIVGDLLRADILRPAGAQNTFVFRHALTQDAAYSTLLRAEREEINARAADCLRGPFAAKAAAQPDLVAHHLLESRQNEEAARWFMRAGLRAAKQAAVEDAVTLYRRGLKALDGAAGGPDRETLEMQLQILLGNALMGVRGFAAPEILPVWERAHRLAEGLGDLDETTSALNGIAAFHIGAGDCTKGCDYANRILTQTRDGAHRIGRLRAHTTLAMGLLQIGDGQAALAHARDAIARYQPQDFAQVTYGVGTDQGVIAYGAAASAGWWLGHTEEALAFAREGVALAETLDSALSLAAAQAFLALTHHHRQDSDEAHRIADGNATFCAHLGIPFWHGFSLLIRGGQPVEAPSRRLSDINEGLAVLAGTGSRSAIGLGFSLLAEAQLATGAGEAGLKMLDMGLQMCAALRQHFWDAEILRVKGEILRARGEAQAAAAVLHEALRVAGDQGSRSLALRAALSLHALREAGGDRETGRAVVGACLAAMPERSTTGDARRAASVLALHPT